MPLKQKVISGMIWSGIERFGTLSITFISNIFLSRLLTPYDFGCIGMLTIFITLSTSLLDSGLGAALIQKKEPTKSDYTTVFTFNIYTSIFLYLILFIASPAIATFYKIPILCEILRIQGLILFINAFRIIQYTYLIKNLEFKKLAIIDLCSCTIGAIIGILFAYKGNGVWSLVINNLAYALIFTTILNLYRYQPPKLQFHKKQFYTLFSFGGIILIANLIDSVYKNIQGLFIGRFFSAHTMGYYTQAKKMEEIPTTGLSSIVNSVLFPVYSNYQNSYSQLITIANKNIIALSYLCFPFIILLIIIAPPIFDFLFSSKWNQSVNYFQILCISAIFTPINMCGLNIIKSLGKAKLYLLLQIIQLCIGIIAIVIGLQFSIEGLLYGIVSSTFLFYLTLTFTLKNCINFGIKTQIHPIFLNLLLSLACAIPTFYINKLLPSINIIQICACFMSYFTIYILLSFIFKNQGFFIYKQIIFKHK